MNVGQRGLLEYVANVVDEELHDLDPARVQGRIRLEAMHKRCRELKGHDTAFVPYGRFRKVVP
jgi:hypothetical protein